MIVVPAEEQAKIRSLADHDGASDAIRYAQSLTGASLDRSRDLVTRIVAGAGVPETVTEAAAVQASLSSRARDVRDTRGTIAAIKLVQGETGLSLARAKSFVDALS